MSDDELDAIDDATTRLAAQLADFGGELVKLKRTVAGLKRVEYEPLEKTVHNLALQIEGLDHLVRLRIGKLENFVRDLLVRVNSLEEMFKQHADWDPETGNLAYHVTGGAD